MRLSNTNTIRRPVNDVFVQVRSIPAPSEEILRVSRFEPDRQFEVDGYLGPFSWSLLERPT